MPAHQGAGAPAASGTAASAGQREPPPGDAVAAGRLEPSQVRAMFDRIAGVYDLMNTAMTAGLHHRWRARAAELASVGPDSRVLDVATGTGDMALELAHRVAPRGEVIGCDFSEEMLVRARAKARSRAPEMHVRFEAADALALPYADGSFDAATSAFGVRNFGDLDAGLREMTRVVRPGGRVVVLEITTPTRAPLSRFYALWFDRLVPFLGRLAGLAAVVPSRAAGAGTRRIADAYTYLPSSVRRFPAPEALAEEMRDAGLHDVSYKLLAGSIIALHVGTVPGEAA
jgi:demethylmenaquinone methyltransferase / 2-methoxy-6-polyprenyl-1,4-benzoquinol methylase